VKDELSGVGILALIPLERNVDESKPLSSG
jgi:hypothetical protein